MTMRAISAILVLTLVIPTGCSPTPVTDDDHAPEGVTEKMNSDAADLPQTDAHHGRRQPECVA